MFPECQESDVFGFGASVTVKQPSPLASIWALKWKVN